MNVPRRSLVRRAIIPAAPLALVLSACLGHIGDDDSSSSTNGKDPAGADAGIPYQFEAVPPSAYVAKVKNLLVGLPPTGDELDQVVTNPASLKSLVDIWMAMPQYDEKLSRFFQMAFEQAQLTYPDVNFLAKPVGAQFGKAAEPLVVQNVTESFARTVVELLKEGAAFTETMTTRRFMMTPALMQLYALADAFQNEGHSQTGDDDVKAQGLTVTIGTSMGQIPLDETLDPSSPKYMHWYHPNVGKQCTHDPMVYSPAAAIHLGSIMWGNIPDSQDSSGGKCSPPLQGNDGVSENEASDYESWKMVTIRQPAQGELPTAFWDVPKLRSTSELVLRVPRVGFFSTVAFFANWLTNDSNQMRVTMNQTLIVATGAQFDMADPTNPPSTPGLDAEHAQPGTDCYACHRLLDPSRSILSANYTYNGYHHQNDAELTAQTGMFAFRGVVKPVASVGDLGDVLAQHPRFAAAWAQKLCYYMNSAACAEDDPEFLRVVDVFEASNYSWNVLVRELAASPLITYATPTKTATESRELVAVERADHLCAALGYRLGIYDPCGRDAFTEPMSPTIQDIVPGLPSDGYGRGTPVPVSPTDPTLFYRSGIENICELIAEKVIDGAPVEGAKQWSSEDPDAAIADFVHVMMALAPSDSRAASAEKLLKSHFAAATAGGASASDALKSTFAAACIAPSAISVGL